MFSTSLLAQMYVSPTGSDLNPGTIDLPFRNLSKAISLAGPDSLIYLRGGIYFDSLTIRLNKTGQVDKPIKSLGLSGRVTDIRFLKTAGIKFIKRNSNIT